jgi:hypothetical protein
MIRKLTLSAGLLQTAIQTAQEQPAVVKELRPEGAVPRCRRPTIANGLRKGLIWSEIFFSIPSTESKTGRHFLSSILFNFFLQFLIPAFNPILFLMFQVSLFHFKHEKISSHPP